MHMFVKNSVLTHFNGVHPSRGALLLWWQQIFVETLFSKTVPFEAWSNDTIENLNNTLALGYLSPWE